MNTRIFKKLYNGLASLRDYEVTNAINDGGIVLEYEGKKMTLSPDELQRGFQCHKKEIHSKFNQDQTFTLVDFRFTPDDMRSVVTQKKILQNRQAKLI